MALITDGLVANWEASNYSSGTSWVDSVNSKTITLSSTPTTSDDGIEFTSSITFESATLTSLSLSYPMTFEWIGRIDSTSFSNTGHIFGLSSNNGGWAGVCCYAHSTRGIQFDIGSSGTLQSGLTTSGDYHIVMTIDSNGITTMYVNSDTAIASQSSGNTQSKISKYYLYNDEGSGRFVGAISSMRLWNKELSSSEITTLFTETYTVTSSAENGSITPSGETVVGKGESITFIMEGENEKQLKTLTVNGIEVEPVDEVSKSLENGLCLCTFDSAVQDDLSLATLTNNGSSISSAQTKFNNSLYLNGSSYLTIDLNQAYSDNVTIEFWFYTTTANSSYYYPTLFSTNTANASGATYVHLDDGPYSTYPVYRCNGSSGNTGTYGDTVITRSTWHHFAYCRNGSSHYYFLDGSLQATVTQASAQDIETIYIGGLWNGSAMTSGCYFTGYVDELLVSNICKWTSSFIVPTNAYEVTEIPTGKYNYTLNNIQEDYIVIATFGSSEILYLRQGGVWTKTNVIKAYKKIDGIWVAQDGLKNVFDSNVKYKKETIPIPYYLTFSSPEVFSISVSSPGWDGTMEYSTNAKTWNTWDGSEISGIEIYIRGTGNSEVTGSRFISDAWTLTGSNIACNGNIENLLDYETVKAGNHPIMSDCCYGHMFSGCTALVQAPELPATTLTSYCYFNMFNGCESLATAPELPATTLASYCYQYMFQGCTALVQAPELPATTLASYCYQFMFYKCTKLTIAPELSATTLANYCYAHMFDNCRSLTTTPELPATTLANYCYNGMFRGCTSLTTVPALPATTLAEYCYGQMFWNCISLKLSTTQTDKYTQEYRIPASGTGTTATNALYYMFSSTGGTFTGTPEINTTYYLHKDCQIV